MRRKALAAILLAALVALSGCAGLANDVLPGGDEPATEEPTEAPQGEPTETTTDGDNQQNAGDIAPGVSKNSVDAKTLATTHADELMASSSFTMKTTVDMTIKTENGTQERKWTQSAKFEDGEGLSVDESPRRSSATWFNIDESQHSWTKTTKDDTTVYSRNDANPSQLTHVSVLQSSLKGFSFKQTGTSEANGQKTYVFKSTGIENKDALAKTFGFRSAEDASMTFEVDKNGVIHSFEIHIQSSSQDFTMSTEFSNIGDTSVSQPDWVETAKDKAYIVNLSAHKSGDYLVFEFKQGEALSPENNRLVFAGGPNFGEVQFNQTLKPGNTYYITTSDSGIKLHAEEPSNVESGLKFDSYQIAGLEGDTFLFQDSYESKSSDGGEDGGN